MNIDNLNPENNNQNMEPNIAPIEPNFGNPPTPGPMDVPPSPAPTPGPMDVPPSPAPMPGPMDVTPSPAPMPGPMDVPPSPAPMPGPMDVPPSPAPMPGPDNSTINLAPEGVVSTTPVVDPLSPLVSAPLTSNTPLMGTEPSNIQNNVPINNANNTINELPSNPATFGGVPTPSGAPIVDNSLGKPAKKKKNKTLLIVLIFVLILGIGGGVYYFLNIANAEPPISVVPTLTDWELGKKLSTNASDYAQISGVDASACTVNVDAVNIRITGTYSYTVSCPGLGEPVISTVKVHDSEGPEVKLKKIIVKPDTEVLVEDFITKCEDPSVSKECDISISDTKIDLEELVKKEGTYKIPLVIKDDYDNETTVEATLTVDADAPTEVLSCELSKPSKNNINATVSEVYDYGLTDAYDISLVTRKITYSFSSQEDYEKVKDDYETTSLIDGLSGDASFDDDNKTIELEIEVSLEDLQDLLNSDSELSTYEDVAIYHEDAGDICSLP